MQLPDPPVCAFASDNAAGAHPAILDAVVRANHGHALAYGDDPETRRCEERFDELFGRPVTTLLAFNGTGANVLALATSLDRAEAVVCTEWSHIAVDETGAPERILGVKLIDLPAPDAKLTPDHLDGLGHLFGVPHHAQPGVVSITQSTELGTLYTADEIGAVCERAHALGMRVHLDGARLANAVAATGRGVDGLREMTVDAGIDVLSFGGTKNGLLGGEAVVYFDADLARRATFVRKQVNQLPSKMRFIAAQFNAALDGGRWIDLASHANEMARYLYDLTHDIPGVAIDRPPAVNSVFPRLAPDAARTLREWCFFYDWDPTRDQVRWMTAWDTAPDDVERFAAGVTAVMSRQN